MNLEVAVVFGLAEGGAVDDQFAADQPKDTHMELVCRGAENTSFSVPGWRVYSCAGIY
jgi:hypothetical protein